MLTTRGHLSHRLDLVERVNYVSQFNSSNSAKRRRLRAKSRMYALRRKAEEKRLVLERREWRKYQTLRWQQANSKICKSR